MLKWLIVVMWLFLLINWVIKFEEKLIAVLIFKIFLGFSCFSKNCRKIIVLCGIIGIFVLLVFVFIVFNFLGSFFCFVCIYLINFGLMIGWCIILFFIIFVFFCFFIIWSFCFFVKDWNRIFIICLKIICIFLIF